MSEPIILAIDLGTSGPKVALLSTRGVVLGGTSEPVPLHILPQGGVEQDPADWWNAICTAARRLLAYNSLARDVRGICVTAQWAGKFNMRWLMESVEGFIKRPHTKPGVAQRFMDDLRASVEQTCLHPKENSGMAPVYGMAATMPMHGLVNDLLKRVVDLLYRVE
jgi:hypothetical protein